VRLAKALLALATGCLGENRQEWALAMQGEFEAAATDGKALAFAIGCLIAACREMPRHRGGRLALASHGLAFSVLIPIAALQFACAMGFANAPTGPAVIHGILTAGGAQGPFLAYPQLSAVPALSLLWLLLGAGQLRLAWLLLERDWWGVLNAGALIVAATMTLFLFMVVLFLDVTSLALQSAVIAVEFSALLAAAHYDWKLSPRSLAEGAA
jgi:hypothetical protein